MEYNEFIKKLNLENQILSITLTNEKDESYEIPKAQCIIKDIDHLKNGTTLLINEDTLKCYGGFCGGGYNDAIPNTPGGFGYFISYGRESTEDEKYPIGERIKSSPEIAEKMLTGQPKDVLDNYKNIVVKHYEKSDNPTLVTMKVTPDQLSDVIYLFNFKKSNYDNVYAAITSGCASLFRMPFHEAKTKSGRGVIGDLDFVSRKYTNKNKVYFTVSGEEFEKMLENADESFMITRAWAHYAKRRFE